MEGCQVTLKDMEKVIVELIRSRLLEEEALMDPSEKKLKERFLVDELTRCGQRKYEYIKQKISSLSKKNIRFRGYYTDGMCFGEHGILSNRPVVRAATIRCLTDSYVATFSRDAYEQTINRIQKFTAQIEV